MQDHIHSSNRKCSDTLAPRRLDAYKLLRKYLEEKLVSGVTLCPFDPHDLLVVYDPQATKFVDLKRIGHGHEPNALSLFVSAGCTIASCSFEDSVEVEIIELLPLKCTSAEYTHPPAGALAPPAARHLCSPPPQSCAHAGFPSTSSSTPLLASCRAPTMSCKWSGIASGHTTGKSEHDNEHAFDCLQNAYTVMLEPAHFQQGAGPAVSEMLWQLAGLVGPEDMDVSTNDMDVSILGVCTAQPMRTCIVAYW
eukprot:1159869-Pelagomonas_calceolata.AAC.9